MSLEKNKNTLRDAVGRMKNYSPDDHLWDKVMEGVDAIAKADESALKRALLHLPKHSPPAEVWNQLTKKMDAQKTPKIVKMYQARKWLSIAAAALVLLVSAIWVLGEESPKVTKMYAQETMQNFQLDIDWNADEGSFDRLKEQLASIDNPTVNNLKLELEELSSARSEVESMLKSYGQDPQLVNQLGDIERERSDIYRQIIELI